MTDTPSPGASADARVHGTPDALANVSVVHLDMPRPLRPAVAEALLGTQPPMAPAATYAHDTGAPDSVVIDASVLKPSLTALVRWAVTLLAAALVQHGLISTGAADQLAPILGGLALAAGTLAWSIAQKRLASRRIKVAAQTEPAKVVLR